MARHRWCNSAAAGFALRAIEGATVLQQVMREKGKSRLAYWFALSHIEQQREKGVESREEKHYNHVWQQQQQQKQQHDYMQIGRPIPASSWSRVLQFARRDNTFVHVITPMFYADGDVSMMMCRKRAAVGWREQCTLHETIIVRV